MEGGNAPGDLLWSRCVVDEVLTRSVDWLAWEDPFIFNEDAAKLKAEREDSLYEIHKRLAYVIPMLQLLNQAGGGWTQATW